MSELNLIVIPVRTGSKGVPGKNFRVLGFLPLFVWTVISAKRAIANLPGDWMIVISTNAVTRTKKLMFEHMKNTFRVFVYERHWKLATDVVQVDEVVLDVLRTYETIADTTIGKIVVLQPTSPFKQVDSIVHAVELLEEQGCGTVLSTYRPSLDDNSLYLELLDSKEYWWENSIDTPNDHSYSRNALPYLHDPTRRVGRQWEPEPDKRTTKAMDDFRDMIRLGVSGVDIRFYRDYSVENGAIYAFYASEFSVHKCMRLAPYSLVISELLEAKINIDTEQDWADAEKLLKFIYM